MDLTNEMPPVGNQGAQGSCVTWAMGYAYRSFLKAQQLGWDYDNYEEIFSPAFIYNQVNGGHDGGTNVGVVGNLLKKRGVTTLADMPYEQYNLTKWPSYENFMNAMKYRIENAGYIVANDSYNGYSDEEMNTLKSHLSSGEPFVITFRVYSDFKEICNQPPYTYTGPSANATDVGGHGVICIGYDDNHENGDGTYGAFKIQNSWSKNWGYQGYFWMSYDYFQFYIRDCYFLIDKVDYEPSIYAKIGINFPSSSSISLNLFVNDEFVTALFSGEGAVSHIELICDLTNYADLLNTNSDIRLEIRNSQISLTGELSEFSIISKKQIFTITEPVAISGVLSNAYITEPKNVSIPELNIEAGAYNEAINLELSSLTEGAQIYYTLDGSEPNENSLLYNGAIILGSSTIVKAIAYKDDLEPSFVNTAEYYIYTDDLEPIIDLSANSDYDNIYLFWNNNDYGKELLGYNLYRKIEGQDYEKINYAVLVNNNFVDSDVSTDNEYFYIVRAVYTDNEESIDSNEINISLKEYIEEYPMILDNTQCNDATFYTGGRKIVETEDYYFFLYKGEMNEGAWPGDDIVFMKANKNNMRDITRKNLNTISSDINSMAIAYDENNEKICAIWDQLINGFYQILYTESSDNGVTWATPEIINDTEENFYIPSISIDKNGKIYAAFLSFTGNLYFDTKDSDTDWGTDYENHASPNCGINFASISASENKIFLSYSENSSNNVGDIWCGTFDGTAFEKEKMTSSANENIGYGQPIIVAMENNTAFMVCVSAQAMTYNFRYGKYIAGNWQLYNDPIYSSGISYFPILGYSEDNHSLYLAFTEGVISGTNFITDIKGMVSNDNGVSWYPAVNFSNSPLKVDDYPSIPEKIFNSDKVPFIYSANLRDFLWGSTIVLDFFNNFNDIPNNSLNNKYIEAKKFSKSIQSSNNSIFQIT